MKLKNYFSIGICVFLLLTFSVSSINLVFPGKALAAEKIKLVLETGMAKSVKQAWGGTGQPWTEAVTKRTNGGIVFDAHFGGELVGMMDMLKGISSGLVQVGGPFVGYWPSQFPLEGTLGTLNYPAFNPPDPVRVAITRILFAKIPEFNDAYKMNNLKKIFIISVPNVGIVSRLPINTLADFNGLKIRTFGKYMSQTVKVAGMTPVNLSYSELIDAISKKVIDATIINFGNARDVRLHEVAKHVIWLGDNNMPAHVIPYSYSMNLNAWNKLPQEYKRIMLEEGKRIEMEYAFQSVKEQIAAAKQMEEEGATIHRLSQKDMDEWGRMCGDLGSEAGKDLDSKGLPGTKAITLIRELAELPMDELMVEYEKAWEKEFELLK
jgi:TRAP-type transport system periplasmic protein